MNTEKAIKDGIKPGEVATLKSRDKKTSSNKDLVGRSSSRTTALPQTMETWSMYHLPDKLKDYFKADIHGSYISTTSIKKPTLSLYYLEKLCDNIHSIGFHHFSIHVVLLMTYIAGKYYC